MYYYFECKHHTNRQSRYYYFKCKIVNTVGPHIQCHNRIEAIKSSRALFVE
jgi:hypothetical protein